VNSRQVSSPFDRARTSLKALRKFADEDTSGNASADILASVKQQADSDLSLIRELAKQVEMKVVLSCVNDVTISSASRTTIKGMRRLPGYEQSKFDVIVQTYQYLDEIITDFKDLAVSRTHPQSSVRASKWRTASY
jgi:hypothetical protein